MDQFLRRGWLATGPKRLDVSHDRKFKNGLRSLEMRRQRLKVLCEHDMRRDGRDGDCGLSIGRSAASRTWQHDNLVSSILRPAVSSTILGKTPRGCQADSLCRTAYPTVDDTLWALVIASQDHHGLLGGTPPAAALMTSKRHVSRRC